MTTSYGPQPSDTLRYLTTLPGIGTTLVPATIQHISPSQNDDYPYCGILYWTYQRRTHTHTGSTAIDLNADGHDPDGTATNYLPTPPADTSETALTVVGGYLVPTDPMDALGCDSCQ